ncbi:MAG: hypothetical protein OHK93_001616 [Ramalina farinacea]|uniref:Uncharacterized protein n=1 Tax=Ramalina farinacea TaxID=258253 RepID=A0AA43TWF7_9LECA|nr:hypothetical protein [Ramalina farinacea]
MVLGLLTIAAIPTTIGIGQGISRRDEANADTRARLDEQMRKFRLECYCEAATGRARALQGGNVVLRGGKMWVEEATSRDQEDGEGGNGFEGFYIEYADNELPKPLPLGMVSMVFEAGEKPTMNWIYVDRDTREVRYGNRTKSREHVVGSWGWESGEEGGAGGVTLEGGEGAVAVETGQKGLWEVRWEDERGDVGVVPKGKHRMQVSLERRMVDEPKVEKHIAETPKGTERTDTKTELTKNKYVNRVEKTSPEEEMVKVTATKGADEKKKEPKLEIASSTVTKPRKEG